MPNNTIDNVAPKLLAAGVMALRENAVTSRLVNRSYDELAAERGSVIDIPIPSAIAATDVNPSVADPTPTEIAPTKAQVTMDFWKKAGFALTDKDQGNVMDGVVPMQAQEAIKGIVNELDKYNLAKMYRAAFNVGGTAGTTPFATTLAAYFDVRKLMNKEAAPLTDRRVILNPDAEANALALSIFSSADARGDQGGVIEGTIGRKFGADWYMNQNTPTHTAGTPGGSPTATGTLGATTVTIAAAGANGTWKAGDKVSFANHAQVYTVAADATMNGSGAGSLTIYPPLRAGVSSSLVTTRASYTANLMFHRDAYAFASRPLANVGSGLGSLMYQAIDEVSGIVLRLEVKRQNKQVMFEYDVLAGGAVIRPELLSVILG